MRLLLYRVRPLGAHAARRRRAKVSGQMDELTRIYMLFVLVRGLRDTHGS